jgi:uncharacterized protein YcaQ
MPATAGATPTFPLRAVAALFLARQHLTRPRARSLDEKRLVAFAADTGGIQVDSINVIDRAHYLTVWSRFGPYDRRQLDRLVYRRRALFEYWAHAACLVPAAHFMWWRRAMLDYSLGARGWGQWLKRNAALVDEIEASIAARGPLGSADFENTAKRGGGGWWNWKPATHALDYLWMSGRTLIDSRVHFHKRFDLAAKVMGEAALAAESPSSEAFRQWHLRQSLHAMGAATATDLRMYLTFPRAEISERRRVLAEAVASGDVVPIAVADENAGKKVAPWYALARDLPVLRAAAAQRVPSRGTTLLTPFDSLLWYRERAQRLFGFDYKIEVYTPGHKRVHGYYVLPLLHDGQLIGRVDAKIHRQDEHLEAKRIHFEPWFARGDAPPAADWGRVDRDGAMAGLIDALQSLAEFLGAKRVTIGRVLPSRFAVPLRRLLREAMSASRVEIVPPVTEARAGERL